jgi:predicted outer membrane repeat protein
MFGSRWNRAGDARLNFRPGVEVLEDRLAPATVTNLLDDGSAGSLRAVLANAQPGDTINFAVTGTIQLSQGPLQIQSNLTISGPGANQLTISGGGASQIFVIGPESGLTLSGVTLANGLAVSGAGAFGGAIDSLGLLSVNGCRFVGNSAIQGGDQAAMAGAIYAQGPTTIASSTFAGNSTNGQGGAVVLNGENDEQVSGCTFIGNSASQGGALAIFNGASFVGDCSFAGNSAGFQGGAIFAIGLGESSPPITRSLFSGNSAPTGASIYTLASISLEFDSFTQNSPDNGVGGIAGIALNNMSLNFVLATTGESFLATMGTGFSNQLIAQVTDVESDGPAGSFAATVSWGDGSPVDAATVLPAGTDANGFQILDVFGAHTYTTDGTFAIQANIVDEPLDLAVTAPATSEAVVLTAHQSGQLTGSQTTTGQAGTTTLTATSGGVTAVLTGFVPLDDVTTSPSGGTTSGSTAVTPNLTTLFVGTYASNPTGVRSTGAAFYDVRVTDAPDESLLVSFQYPAGFSDPVLLFFDPATQSFQPVKATVLFNDTAHHELIVLINSASVPTLATLGHTVFTIGVGVPAAPAADPAMVAPLLAAAGNTLPAPTAATFTSTGQLTLTLTPLQQGQLAFSQAPASGVGGGDGQADSSNVPFRWAWDLLGLDGLWRVLSAPANRNVPGPEPSPATGAEEDSSPNQPDPAPGAGVESLLPHDDSRAAVPIGSNGFAPTFASQAERRAALGLFFAGAALLQERKRRPAV